MQCPYKYALGIPEQGVHASRIFGYALFDTVATLIGALLTAYFTNTSLILSIIFWFVLGEVLHYVFGVQTAVLTTMGIEACPKEKNEIIEPI